ncbi:MAG TPA: phenylalanine--tRNA ligase beta subunit-related protein [Paludibacter sp.]|nr:phenylalanine--tRNA ligase beta subunit-related protein [Paludibacter sp.]
MKITISDQIREACPQLALSIIECEVGNSPTSTSLSGELDAEIQKIRTTLLLDEINKRPEIVATRLVYKKLGKDPNRYRPSAEALCRRIVRGVGIYRAGTLVDIINLVSIRSGFSIGGFDVDKISGDIELGVGTVDDYFEAIGRGVLNVEGLPLYRDVEGGIGTPTSDNERTKISGDTTRLLIIINGYGGERGLKDATDFALDLLQRYAGLKQPDCCRLVKLDC